MAAVNGDVFAKPSAGKVFFLNLRFCVSEVDLDVILHVPDLSHVAGCLCLYVVAARTPNNNTFYGVSLVLIGVR